MSARDKPRDNQQTMVHSTKEWGQEDAAPQKLLYFQIKRLINALTTDDSRKGRQLSHKWELRTELQRSRQEAVAGKAHSSSRSWILDQLKAERRCLGP